MKTIHHIVRILNAFALIMLICCFSGCVSYQTPVMPPRGFLFSNYTAPLTVDFDNIDCSGSLIKASKSKTYYFWDFILTGMTFAWGEADIADVASEKGIEKVSFADHEFFSIFGIYATFTINVHGYGPEKDATQTETEKITTVRVAATK